MLRTNLATRPFYNERAVYVGLGLVAVAGLAVLGLEVVQIMELSRRNTELVTRAERAEAETAQLSAQTAEIQQAVSPQALEQVASAAREVNTLIDQRVFSWTDFFNRIETTLPPDVMLTQVQPDISPDRVEVTMGVLGRRLDDISSFIDELEASGDFDEVLNRQAELTEEGMYRAVLRGRYLQVLPDGPLDQETEAPGVATDGPNPGEEAPAADDAGDADDTLGEDDFDESEPNDAVPIPEEIESVDDQPADDDQPVDDDPTAEESPGDDPPPPTQDGVIPDEAPATEEPQ